MKAFVGIRDGNGLCHLYLKDGENLTKIPPDRSQAVYNHSPDGYEWGYSGSGPSQLALAIMLEITGNDRRALTLYHEFKFAVVSGMPSDYWSLPVETVQKWVIENEPTEPLTV